MCDLDGCGTHHDLPPIELADADRRAFLKGAMTLPLATVLAFPELAQAQAAKLEEVSVETASGNTVSGVIAMPAVLPAPTVLLIHEWWGLNDSIKTVAAELAELGYIALAIDLHGGKVGTTPDEARALTRAVKPDVATDQLSTAISFLRDHESSTGKVATLGWCFGGGWSLNASIAAPVDATVIYYGRVTPKAVELAKLQGPVLGHFGTEDRSIDEVMVGGFQREMAAAGKADLLQVEWYTANHAFANPTGTRYDADDAALAWSRTQTFFAQHLWG